jgi:hypothetical protein
VAKKKESAQGAKVSAPGEPVYTVMAFVTFVALAIGCTLLYLDYDEYGGKTAPGEKVPTLTKLGDASQTGGGVPAPGTGGPAPMPTPMTGN